MALTAAVVCSLFLYQNEPYDGLAFYGSNMDEKHTAFLQFLAKYGKTYATKSDMGSRFKTFSDNYDLIQAHNSAKDERASLKRGFVLKNRLVGEGVSPARIEVKSSDPSVTFSGSDAQIYLLITK